MTDDRKENLSAMALEKALSDIKEFLTQDNLRYNVIGDDAVELFMQARNLTIRLLIYVHNGHVIFRVPNYIRNVNLNRLEIFRFIMQVTSEILDIRFEIGPDGKSLSACCQHILEDGTLTRAQFDLAMMIILHIVDDTFPQFMKLVYNGQKHSDEFAPVKKVPGEKSNQPKQNDPDSQEEDEELLTEEEKKGLKIN
ncbi:MAG: hypothetical protein PWR01_3149 [Clostridiales bacterium]|jgi:hypothetical protein|nr:hypothetical protein [Clostridiales bacterium]MDN5282076.1 hypothetical protein [Candidatus Ozemobacter sp.]